MASAVGVVTYKADDLTAFMSIENVKIAKTSEVVEQVDEAGNVAATHLFKKKHTLTAAGTLETVASLPAIGDTLTVNLVAYELREVNDEELNDALCRCDVTGVYDVPTA